MKKTRRFCGDCDHETVCEKRLASDWMCTECGRRGTYPLWMVNDKNKEALKARGFKHQ